MIQELTTRKELGYQDQDLKTLRLLHKTYNNQRKIRIIKILENLVEREDE